MAGIQVSKDPAGRVIISFPYDPLLVEKVKTIAGRRWHPAEKHWSFPSTDGMLEKILKIFGDENVQIDPSLQAESPTPRGAVPDFVVSAQSNDLQMDKPPNPPLEKGGERGFEDLRRELVSRKYSYKTVKGYIYYNRDFLNFTAKAPSEVNDNDIKDYLLYLAEEKESATATINQAINALKFYYGAMLKKKFVYEVRRPRKDKKLPRCAESGGGGKNTFFGEEHQASGDPNARLFSGTKGRRSRPVENRRHRQPENADPYKRCKGKERQIYNAFRNRIEYTQGVPGTV